MWWKLLKVLTVLSVYSAAVEPRFVARNDEVAMIPNLPPAWEGKRIAVFADLQVGMRWANVDAARRLVRRVAQLQPAFVLIPGDFVYGADRTVDDQMRRVLDILQPILRDSIPTYAVLGNHDYSMMNEQSDEKDEVARKVVRALESAGVHVMDNAVRPLSLADSAGAIDTLYLAGIGERWAKNDSSAEAVAKVPSGAPRVVFMHDPDSFVNIPAGAAPFAVAAHTHGMQVGIPWVSDYIWRHYFSDEGSGVEGWQKNWGQAGNRVYINRGVGFSVVPARLHAFPELTVFTLRRAP